MRTLVEQIHCDLCGYGGDLTRPEDFVARPGGVDLCHWCAADPTPRAWMECGRHRVTFAADWSWSCTCRAAFQPPAPLSADPHTVAAALRPARVLAAVPNLRYALARIHSESG